MWKTRTYIAFSFTILFIANNYSYTHAQEYTDNGEEKAVEGGKLRGQLSDENSKEEMYMEATSLDGPCPVFTENPEHNKDLQDRMIKATKTCGYYKKQGCHYEVIPSNVVHPGEGVGDLESIPYIVQFDIGIHPNIKDRVLADHRKAKKGEKRDALSEGDEQCLEIIVKGNSDATGGCAGKCGPGCVVGAGWAKDCMKHDVCAAYKALKQLDRGFKFYDGDGFCYDPDCGDEAAQTVFNCYVWHWSWDTPITCESKNFNPNPHHKYKDAYGHWSYATSLFGEGACGNFVDRANGQGFPDWNKIENPY